MTDRSPAPAVLVADDDVELRDAVANILETSGFEVLTASDGDGALATALSADVDIIVLDENMPGKSGVDLLQALREAGCAGPIIIIGDAETRDGPPESGLRWLRQPFDAEQLLGAVRRALAAGAPASANVGSTGHQPVIGEVLSRAEEALARRENGASSTRHAELKELCERLRSLDDERIRRIDEASVPFQQILEHAIAAGRHRTMPDRALRIDLRTVLRGLRCLLDIAVASGDGPSMDRYRIRYQEVALARLTRRVGRCFDDLARGRRVAFDVVAPERFMVEADGEKLERVLLTLLCNAFKHTPVGGAVECRLEQEPHDGEVSLVVSDSGPKIPPGQELALAPDLHVARELVELHGGTLTLRHRRSGRGFRATLPRWSPRGVAVSDVPFAGTPELAARAAEMAATELTVEKRLVVEPAARDGGPLDVLAIAELESRVKSGFLRMMAHELKTPITAMHLQMRLMEREAELPRSPGLRAGLVRIARSSHRLVQLIDTCIEWARVESKRFQVAAETFDLVPLVSQVVGEFESHIERKKIRIDFVPGAVPSVTSDRKLARLALLNLISYAVQNTDSGAVSVSVEAMDGVHRVRVTDGGAPVEAERRRELFAPLLSDEDLNRQAGSGSGLGLYVVRDIVRAIGGDVVLDPAGGTGNTFVLSLPELPEGIRRR